MTFTLMQAIQFAGLLPCLFLIVALYVAAQQKKLAHVPALYLFILAVSFSIPLQGAIGDYSWGGRIQLISLFLDALLPVASYLLIMQFLTGRVPAFGYWLSFAIPLIGGGPFIYSAAMATDVCVWEFICTSTHTLQQLYMLFATSLLFLLLIVTFSRVESQIDHDDVNRRHKYWLILALILMNVILLVAKLAEMAQRISLQEMAQVQTIVKISFLYLVMTSLFRVFDRALNIHSPLSSEGADRKVVPKDVDPEFIARMEALLNEEKSYRKMGFSREALAKALDVGEHVISRTVNRYYEMNFNEWINRYRIEEAKERLSKEDTTITVIAFEVGFNSIASFNRVFKQQVGVSPTAYRTENGVAQPSA